MKTSFARFRVWPADSHELDGVWCFGRSAQEAADEAFLDFIDISEPPPAIRLNVRHDETREIVAVIVEPAGRDPFVERASQPVLPFERLVAA